MAAALKTEGEPLRLLYIAGSGRSGSTLLARLLGEIRGHRNLGEAMRGLFNDRMLERLPLCGCGIELGTCPFWGRFVGQIDPAARRFATREIKLRTFPKLAYYRRRGRMPPRFDALAGEMVKLLAGAAAGARLLIDASKHPVTALMLCGLPGLRLDVVHLVREPRAVVASWSRAKGYLRAHSAIKVALWWVSYNLAAERLSSVASGYQRIRYEDLVDRPAESLQSLLAGFGHPPADLSFLRDGVARLGTQHLVAGNPDRSQTGEVRLGVRPWKLSSSRRALTAALSLPLLRRYGYPVRGVA